MIGAALHDIPEERIFDLVERLDVRGPRYTSYPTVPVWTDNFPAEPYLDALHQTVTDGRPVAVYLHFPFCKSRCLYCGCNSYISSNVERHTHYVEALLKEIEQVGNILNHKVENMQLHLGGGTPTHTPLPLLAKVLEQVEKWIPGAKETEYSIEVDPRVTTHEYLNLLVDHGFRRISIGLQDLNPDVQQAICRQYSFEQMAEFVMQARTAGFTSVNIDLIYGLPKQTRATWSKTLEAILKLHPDRLACFGYAHLPSRMKHQQAIMESDLPSPRERLGMILDAHRFFTKNGFNAIGMDHFAKPEDELSKAQQEGRVWRNFMGYTTIRGLELIAMGCSSISEFHNLFVQNRVAPEAYADDIHRGEWAVCKGHLLDPEDRWRKQIINHLMCNLEISIPAEIAGESPELYANLSQALDSLKPYEQEELIIRSNGGYTITPLGQLFLRNLAMPFDRYLDAQVAATFSRTV